MNKHISLRDLGIAILAPVCMILVQDSISAILKLLFQEVFKESRDIGFLVSLLSYSIVIIISAVIFNTTEKKAGLTKLPPLRTFLLFLLLFITGMSMQFLSTGILNIIDMHHPDLLNSYKGMVQNSFSLKNGAIRVATVMFVAPVAEELIFRGISLRSFQRFFQTILNRFTQTSYSAPKLRCGDVCAICMSAVLFGLFHGNVVQFCYAVPSGVVLALIALWTSSLLPSIFLHITINVSSYAVDSIFADLSASAVSTSDSFYAVITACSSTVCIISLILIYILLLRRHPADH